MKVVLSPVRTAILAGTLFLTDVAYRQLSGEGIDAVSLSLALLNGVLLGLLFAWLVPLLDLRRLHLVGLLWLTLFIVEFASSMLEGYFFTTVFASVWQLLSALPVVALFALLQAGFAGFVLETKSLGAGLSDAFRRHLATRTGASWAWRIAVASAAYLPIYFFFGALVGPFVIDYYAQAGIGLVLPPFTVIIPLELARGLLYVMALFPILVALRGDRWTPFIALAALLYIPGAILPLLTRVTLPVAIIPFHSLELLADSLVYAFVLSRILKPGFRVTEEMR